MTVEELAEITKLSRTTIYKLAKRLNRLPTVEEANAERKPGRPLKYK